MQPHNWTSKVFCTAALLLLVGACGEVKAKSPDGGGSGDGDFTVMVDPTSLTVPIAGSADLTIAIERIGAIGDITLSASGLGSNLEATFSPEVIPDGMTSGHVTISVVGGTAPSVSTVTLTGTAAGTTHSVDVTVTTTTITVTGRVRGNLPGVTVGLIGKASVTTGLDGAFTFNDVTPPYDLYTVHDNGCGSNKTPTVIYFDDLTRPDPIVSAGTYSSTCTITMCNCEQSVCFSGSNVSGTKSGAGNNTDQIVWGWSAGSFSSPVLNTDGTYSGRVSWCSGNTSSGSLYAVQFTKKSNGAPDTFLGLVKTPSMTLTDGTPKMIDLPFTSINSVATIAGTLNGPPGYPTPSVALRQQFGNSFSSLWTADTTSIDAVFPLIPTAGGNSLYASSNLAGHGTSYYLQPLIGDATVDFTMPAAAEATMPTDMATGVTTSTMFAWSAPPGVLSTLSLAGAGASYIVYTMRHEATIPNVPELALPAGTTFNWGVFGYAPAASVDDAAAPNGLGSVYEFSGPAHAYTVSTFRSFTSQ